MNAYDQNLRELQKQVILKKQLESKLYDLMEQRKTFESKATALRTAYSTELEDVQKLEGKSIAVYFYQVIGKLDDKLDKERKEACAALLKLEAAQQELAAVDNEIADIQEQLSSLEGVDRTFTAELSNKRRQLKESGSTVGLELMDIAQQITQLKVRRRQINEAKEAGKSALETTDNVLSELRDAKDWNTCDIFSGGGIYGAIVHSEKHGHLDDAQDSVYVLQSKLRRFRTELSDVQIKADIRVNMSGFTRFTDYFFDGLIVDCSIGDQINASQNAVWEVRGKICNMLTRLENMGAATDKKIQNLTAKEEELVVQA